MRLVLAAGLLLSQVSVGLIWLLAPVRGVNFENLIPTDILGLIILRNPTAALESLSDTRLDGWLDTEADRLRERIPERLRQELNRLLERDLKSAWFLIHEIERRGSGSWRVHFTAFLVPTPQHQEAIALQIELAVRTIFGFEQTRIFERENVRIYTGNKTGQILYQVRMPELVLVSNSDEGWLKTLRTTLGREPSLAEDSSFRRIKSHLGIDGDLFVYLRANQLLPLFPEFGYVVRWKDGRAWDDYYEVERR